MKKGIRRLTLLAAALLVLLSAACARPEELEEESGHLLYFLSPEDTARGGDAITGVRVDLHLPEDAGPTEEAAAVVEGLIQGAEGHGTLLKDVQLRSINIVGRRAYVDFSPNYAALTGIELSLADYCVTLSLSQIEGISAVTITAAGRDLFYRDSAVLMSRDVLLSSMEDVIETVPVTLYFRSEEGDIVPEERLLELYEGQTLAESLLRALLEGPRKRGLSAVIPEGFVFNGIRVEDRVCYLSLSSKAMALLPEAAGEQEAMLRSIALSLYSMDTVDELCILSDGEELQQFGQIPIDVVSFRPNEGEV